MPLQPGLSQSASYATGQLSQDTPTTGLAKNPTNYLFQFICLWTHRQVPLLIYRMIRMIVNSTVIVLDEGELSDSGDKHEVTEDMIYRETVRSVRSFMGWNHIPVFEADFSERDKSNNPWKGKVPKRPARISVPMPPDHWLCQKCERLNTTVAEGYLLRSQDSGGLKKDQFIKMPKSQSRWYQMHTIKPDAPHRPGKSVFSWRNTEAKVNSQFPTSPRLLLTHQLVQFHDLLPKNISTMGEER